MELPLREVIAPDRQKFQRADSHRRDVTINRHSRRRLRGNAAARGVVS